MMERGRDDASYHAFHLIAEAREHALGAVKSASNGEETAEGYTPT